MIAAVQMFIPLKSNSKAKETDPTSKYFVDDGFINLFYEFIMGNKLKIAVTDPAKILSIIQNYPLATVITHLEDSIEISQLPLVAEMQPDGSFKLFGHLSTRNPQWRHLQQGARMTLVFNGPNTYVNSSWYAVNDVSTWNYITVQASGTATLLESYPDLLKILKATTDLTNRLYKDQWDFYIPDDLKSEKDLTTAIGGFSLVPSKIKGTFKISQSKNLEDQKNIIRELQNRKDENSQKIAEFMTENIES